MLSTPPAYEERPSRLESLAARITIELAPNLVDGSSPTFVGILHRWRIPARCSGPGCLHPIAINTYRSLPGLYGPCRRRGDRAPSSRRYPTQGPLRRPTGCPRRLKMRLRNPSYSLPPLSLQQEGTVKRRRPPRIAAQPHAADAPSAHLVAQASSVGSRYVPSHIFEPSFGENGCHEWPALHRDTVVTRMPIKNRPPGSRQAHPRCRSPCD